MKGKFKLRGSLNLDVQKRSESDLIELGSDLLGIRMRMPPKDPDPQPWKKLHVADVG